MRALVAECNAARGQAQFGELRKAVDQVLRNAVAEILLVGIAAGIDEGKDRQRIDRPPRPIRPI